MSYRELNCSTTGANTGIAGCIYNPKKMVGIFLVPKGAEIPTAELAKTEAELVTYIKTKIFETAKNNRWYPVKEFVSMTDNSEETVFVTKGYGTKEPVRDGKYAFIFETNGGLCLSNSLRSFNNKKMGIFIMDDSGKLIGSYTSTGMKAINLDLFYQHPVKQNDGTNPPLFRSEVVLTDAKDLNENIDFYQFNDIDPLDEFSGLVDLTVKQITDAGAATIKVQILEACSKDNIGETYNGELDVVGAFVSTRTITAVSYDALTKSFILTVATTWAAADTIALASPTALAALLVVGFESDTLAVVATV